VRLFNVYEIPITQSFTRTDGAEQIDGAIMLPGWHYLIECRWRKKPADTRDLDGLVGQVNRSGKQTMGIFLSINHWSPHVVSTLKQNPDKSVILVNGFDLRAVLEVRVDLQDFLIAKSAELNLKGEPYLSVQDYLGRT
jgi:hypothetical protein